MPSTALALQNQYLAADMANPFDQFDAKPPSSAANPFDQFDMRAAAQPTPTTQATQRPFFEAPNSIANTLGPLEAAAHFASGIGGQIVGGLAGLGAIPVNLARGQSLSDSVANAGNVVTGVENAMTYDPRTALGHDITNVVQYPFQKYGELADYAGGKVADLTGSPLAGTAVNTAINAAPMLLGAKGDFGAPVAKVSVPDAVANARSLGFALTPTQAQGGLLGRIGESLSSHAKLERNLSRQNAQAVDTAAGNAVGINGPVTADSLQAAKAQHNAVYDEVGSLGAVPTDAAYQQALSAVQAPGAASFPGAAPTAIDSLRAAFDVPSFDAGDAVQMTRQLRADASKNIKAPFDPERNALGFAQRNVSDALEAQIERHIGNMVDTAQQLGLPSAVDPGLLSRFQNARQSLAKIHSVEDALQAGKGQAVSAANLGKQLQKGIPLSGDLRTIAESAQNFPRSFQDLDKIRNSGPLSMLPTYGGGLLTAAHPSAWPALAGAVLGPPTIRALLGSDLYQRAAFDPRIPQTAARPGLLGLGGTAALAGQNAQPGAPLLMLVPQSAAQ